MEEENVNEKEPEKEKKHAFLEGHAFAPPEWLRDTDFPSIHPEVADALDMGQQQIPQVVPDRIYIKTLIRRVSAMRILKFFLDRNDAFYLREVADGVRLSQATCHANLRTLVKAGLMLSKIYKNVNDETIDQKTLYFMLVNKPVSELVMKQYLWHVSFQLGHYIPYKRIAVREIKEDQRFVEKCGYFGLTFNEAVDVVKECPKVLVKYEGGYTFLSRRSQGYIPPKKEEIEKFSEEVKSFVK